MMQQAGQGAGLSLVMDQDGKRLLAVIGEGAAEPIDADRVNRMLALRGFSELFIFADAVDRVVKQHNAGTAMTLVIGERRDGAFTLNIDPDLMGANLTPTPAYGGRKVTADDIHAALLDKKVVFGILDDTIDAAVEKGYARNKVIAQGTPPVPGEDARFISLVRKIDRSPTDADDRETVDYRDIGNVVTVKRLDPLMRRLPPTAGTPGTNILGAPVPPVPGTDLGFSPLITGAETSRDDPDLLVASIAGQPFPIQNGVKVEPVITIRDVDLSTGNLDIEGSLNVTGDVKPGMRVKATADVVIEGMVEAGHIEAGGSVEVRGAVIGQGEPRNGSLGINPAAAAIRAEGSVKAQFVENAFISSGEDIFIREFVMKSELNAANVIVVGEPGSGKGRVINSICRAGASIQAVTVGSRSGTGTVLEVGADPAVKDKFTAAKQVLHTREREFEELSKALEYYREHPDRNPPEAVKEKEKALRRVQTEIQEYKGQLRRLKKRLEIPADAFIKAEQQVFSGVRISIGEKSLHLENDMGGATFRLGEEGIEF